jgi:GH24 family phage-related lysozyme (muramidase)
LKINAAGEALVKGCEGLELTAYYDAVGVLTIGWGHTGSDVYEGMQINEAQAQALFNRDIVYFEDAVNRLVKVPLNENQFSALVSFVYNIGDGGFADSTALRRLNQGDYAGCCEAMQWWTKGNGGEVLAGLVTRRKAEVRLFNTPVVDIPIPVETSNKPLLKGGACKLRMERDSWFKLAPVDSTQLADSDEIRVRAGMVFQLLAWKESANGHLLITLDHAIAGRNSWHVWSQDVRMKSDSPIIKSAASDEVVLKIPYLSQLDNTRDPYSTCNVTSVAMCMAYFGRPVRNSRGEQLEDELDNYCFENHLSRHSPTDLARLAIAYGYHDEFQPDARWNDVKAWLAKGNPIIVHGYFTKSGHIIVIGGYNSKGWVVFDPYGEWYKSGYDRNDASNPTKGAGLTYSYGMMERLCGSDGDLWIHYFGK